MEKSTLSLTVIICTYNRPRELCDCLIMLSKQRRNPEEIIVVDASTVVNNVSTQLKYLFGDLKTQYIKSTKGLTRQRNIGLGYAHGDVISFIDDDVELALDYYETIMGVFERNPEIGGCTGRIRNVQPYRIFSRFARRFFLLDSSKGTGTLMLSGHPDFFHFANRNSYVQILSGCNMNFRANAIMGLRFDESLVGYSLGEDVDFTFSLSKKCLLCQVSSATLFHYVSRNSRDNAERALEMLLHNSRYLSIKHFGDTKRTFLAWTWSAIGVGVMQLVAAVKGRDYALMKAYFSALKSVW